MAFGITFKWIRLKICFVLVLFLFVFKPFQVIAQELSDSTTVKFAAKQHINKLKSGVLIVRLETKIKNLKALESTIVSKGLKPKLKATLQESLQKIINDRDSLNQLIINGFSGELYSFSEVYFMHDTSTTSFLNNQTEGYFFDKDGIFQPGMSIEGKDYYLIYLGRTNQESSTNTESFVVCDKYLNPLDKPFPAFITFRKMLGRGKTGPRKKRPLEVFKGHTMEEAIQKVNETFFWFHEKANSLW